MKNEKVYNKKILSVEEYREKLNMIYQFEFNKENKNLTRRTKYSAFKELGSECIDNKLNKCKGKFEI